jgi:hypothetical protein
MWGQARKINKPCEELRDALERSTSLADDGRVVALGTLLARLPERARQHLETCSDCRIFADELIEVRGMFEGEVGGPQPGPFFLARLMTAIADREVELERSTQTWAAVPRLAYRLSVLASLTILIAGSWLYQGPAHPSAVAGIGAEPSSEGLVEGSGTVVQDDFLLSAADR